MATNKTHWDITNMPPNNQARRVISAYAVKKNITLAEALQEIVILAGI